MKIITVYLVSFFQGLKERLFKIKIFFRKYKSFYCQFDQISLFLLINLFFRKYNWLLNLWSISVCLL